MDRQATRAGILGCGYALPAQVRRNHHPVLAAVKRTTPDGISELDLFTGLRERRCLAAGERIETFMVDAARDAMRRAGVGARDIGRLYGYGSVSSYLTPNSLYEVHGALHLPQSTAVIPINCEFSNFLAGLVHATEAVVAGGTRYALVVCGSNWTKHLDYTTGHAFTAGDAAAAAVVGPSDRFVLVDHETVTHSADYRSMTMKVRPVWIDERPCMILDKDNLPVPTYEMADGPDMRVFSTHLRDGLPDLVLRLLERNNIRGDQISLITHQASRLLLDHWAARIAPKDYLETLQEFGNMTLATYPVNLAHFYDRIRTPYVILAAVGTGFHLAAVLLAT